MLLFIGNRLNSARQASFDALQYTPKISFMNLKCNFSNSSESLGLEKTPYIYLR